MRAVNCDGEWYVVQNNSCWMALALPVAGCRVPGPLAQVRPGQARPQLVAVEPAGMTTRMHDMAIMVACWSLRAVRCAVDVCMHACRPLTTSLRRSCSSTTRAARQWCIAPTRYGRGVWCACSVCEGGGAKHLWTLRPYLATRIAINKSGAPFGGSCPRPGACGSTLCFRPLETCTIGGFCVATHALWLVNPICQRRHCHCLAPHPATRPGLAWPGLHACRRPTFTTAWAA